MKTKIIITLTLTVLFSFLSCQIDDNDTIDPEIQTQAFLNRLYDNEIAFQNEQLIKAAIDLNTYALKFSANKNEESLFIVQNQWMVFLLIWKELEVLTIGPSELTNQVSQIHQWPADQSRIQGFIESNEIIDENFVLSQGVDTRGLAVVEYLIFGKDLASFIEGETASNQTDYLLAISESLVGIVNEYVSFWEAYEVDFKSELSNSISGSQNQIINGLIFKLEEILKSKLQEPLAIDTGGDLDVTLTEAYLSEESIYIINEEIRQIEQVFTGNLSLTQNNDSFRPVGLYDQLQELDLERRLESQFREIEIILRSIIPETTLEEQLVTDTSKVFELIDAIQVLSTLVKTDVVSELNVVTPFNDTERD